jgi:hypothetical protein
MGKLGVKQYCIMQSCENKANAFFLNTFEVKEPKKLNKTNTFCLLPVCTDCEKIVSDESTENSCSIKPLVY